MMNEKAVRLKLYNTHFVTPHGLDNIDHYTTALELAKLTDYALENKKFKEIVSTKTYNILVNGAVRTINNTNELLGNINGVNGVKTGFTANAMRCLVSSCTRNENQIITVVLGCDTKKKRTQDSIKLIEYAFNNFERVNLEEIVKGEFNNWKQLNNNRININKGKYNKIEISMDEIKNKIIPIKTNTLDKITIEINCIYNFEAPVYKNTKIGNVIIKYEGNIVDTVDIKIAKQINKKNVFNYFLEILGKIPTCLDFSM